MTSTLDLKQLWERHCAFWFDEAAVAPLAVARIGLGASMFAAYLMYTPFVDEIFGPDGLGAYTMGKHHFIREHTWSVWAAVVVSAFCFMIGLGTRLAGLVLLVGHLIMIEPGRFFSWGWVPTVPAFLAYLTLGSSHAQCSVDAWLQQKFWGRPPKTTAPVWCIRLLQAHIVAIYLGAGWHRIHDIAWWRGEMVYDAVTYAYFSRLPGVDWSLFKLPLALANYVVWGLELAAPAGLLLKQTRLWFALGLWLMHFGLELTSTIGWWQFMMMSVLFVYFPNHWSENLLRPSTWRPGRLLSSDLTSR